MLPIVQIDRLIDRLGIAKFLEMVETICSDRAKHTTDPRFAKAWDGVAVKVGLAIAASRELTK